MSENNKLRALLAEARAWDLPEEACKACQHPACEIARRIDAALAEPMKTGIDYQLLFRQAARDRDEARAEVKRLRGVDCGVVELDGTTSPLCGVCLECAHRRGAEAMREAAAQIVERETDASDCVDAICALPIPEDK